MGPRQVLNVGGDRGTPTRRVVGVSRPSDSYHLQNIYKSWAGVRLSCGRVPSFNKRIPVNPMKIVAPARRTTLTQRKQLIDRNCTES